MPIDQIIGLMLGFFVLFVFIHAIVMMVQLAHETSPNQFAKVKREAAEDAARNLARIEKLLEFRERVRQADVKYWEDIYTCDDNPFMRRVADQVLTFFDEEKVTL